VIDDVPAKYRGTHGYDPERPEMAAALLVVGPDARAGHEIANARMIDVGPTVAGLLGLRMPAATGKALALR
jgi:predicted AlkP superfamily pyrophosphatase or phosphodiesterase